MNLEHHATALTCTALRQEYREDTSISILADEYSLNEATVRHHLYGNCEHDITASSVTPAGATISKTDCEQIRSLAVDGQSLSDIVTAVGYPEEAVVDHATGFCGHRETGPTVDREEIAATHPQATPISSAKCAELRGRADNADTVQELADETSWSYSTIAQHIRGDCGHDVSVAPRESKDRHVIKPSDCRYLRNQYNKADSIREVARETKWSYQSALKHICGDCSHDIAVPPREKEHRKEVDAKQCRALRSAYRRNIDITSEELASRYGLSENAVRTHLQMRCAHPVDKAVVTLLQKAGLSEAAASAEQRTQ